MKRSLLVIVFKLFVFLFFYTFFTKDIYAVGTCSCDINASGRTWYISSNNCDVTNEYASGCEGSAIGNPSAKCVCIKKENSGLAPNTCTCNYNTVTDTKCQGETPRENCISRGSDSYCYCSAETSNLTDTYIPPRPGTPEDLALKEKNEENDVGCINTALGCINPDINQFTTKLLEIIFGISGGIAFLLMVYGFILMATSSGDEKKVQGAKETITSAITGLLISIFALFIFRLIAVNILQIPGIN